jgi:predicted ArsR family transcriptional regulator
MVVRQEVTMAAEGDYDAAALMASPVRRALVDALEQQAHDAPVDPGMTAAELAPRVGLHVTTVRFHLDQLVAAGVLNSEFRRQVGAGRPRKIYLLTAKPQASDGHDPLRLLTALLVEAMTAGVKGEPVTPVEAGRRWAREHLPVHENRSRAETPGTWLARVGEMIDALEDWGYHPELSTSEGGRAAEVVLTDCPFFDLARDNEAVVCGVHQGLIVESMRRFGETGTEVSLEPFVAPNRCLAHLRTTAPFRSP